MIEKKTIPLLSGKKILTFFFKEDIQRANKYVKDAYRHGSVVKKVRNHLISKSAIIFKMSTTKI